MHISEIFRTFAENLKEDVMAPKITLVKNYRNKETLRLVELQELAEMIRQGEYEDQVREFRKELPLKSYVSRSSDGTLEGYANWPKELPRICFALEQENRNHELVTRGYTGLVLLEVNNLTGQDEAAAVRRGAGEMPQTLMAFVGADGQSVKIVCRGELLEVRSEKSEVRDYSKHDDSQPQNYSLTFHPLPLTSEEIALFHENLYERARLIYNGQLGVTVEKLEPSPRRICYMSHDPQLVFNPLATPIYTKVEKPTEALNRQPSTQEQTDYDRYRSNQIVYEYNLTKAFDDTEGIADKAERRHATLKRLAAYCQETGLPMGTAQWQAMMEPSFWGDEIHGEEGYPAHEEHSA